MTLSHFFALNVEPSKAIPGSYDYTLVLLSYLVAAFGSYAFLQFATRIAELRDGGKRIDNQRGRGDRLDRDGRRHLGDAFHRHAGAHSADSRFL